MRTTDWNDWDTFCTVATLGSFTRAADRLGLPKSSVSTAVSRLEGKLGARLFERSTRRLRLTDAGEALLRDAGPCSSACAKSPKMPPRRSSRRPARCASPCRMNSPPGSSPRSCWR